MAFRIPMFGDTTEMFGDTVIWIMDDTTLFFLGLQEKTIISYKDPY